MPGWDNWNDYLKEGFKQAREEGREEAAIAKLEPQIETALGEAKHGDDSRAASLLEQLLAIPVSTHFPFNEPDDLESIKWLRADGVRHFNKSWSDDELLDKLHGAWLGRCSGCALGKPIEGFMGEHNGLKSWERQKKYLTAISPDEWPLKDYIPADSPAREEAGGIWCDASQRENISYMESDDDIRYTVLGQILLREKGRDFTSWDVARGWISRLPYAMVCTAETQAYHNLVQRYNFHLNGDDGSSVDWNWVATHFNPYREWIGAQIRIDSYGYAAPGNPELAAEFAWRDARISHVKNGIYGAMLCAAMIAASFAIDEALEIVEAGLTEIPQTSRLYKEMRQTIEICAKYNNDFAHFEDVIRDIYELLGHYHPVHTNNNAALCVAGVLLAQGDFHKGITFAVMGGLDTDCNGATVGSIVGAMTGARNAPQHWTARLNDTLNSEIIGYHPIAISECARRALEIARKINA
jgi:ADP-ribosylglycohydrolase